MAAIKVHAGDFLKGDSSFTFGVLMLRTKEHSYAGETIPLNQLEHLEIASEESVKNIGGAIGWGAIGGLALGPAGLLAGLLLGGKKNEVTFIAKLKDGRRLLATTDSKTYTKLKAAIF
jgi:hypothetical protein